MSYGFFMICNLETSKNKVRYMIFSDYIIRTPPPKHHFSREKQFGLYNLNSINSNSKHVCNMDSHFRDNINLPNSSLCFGSLIFVHSEKSGFRATWLDCSETFLENQKNFKEHDSHKRDFLHDSSTWSYFYFLWFYLTGF